MSPGAVSGMSPGATSRISPGAVYGVNGRFLAQPVTGVQRYARNVLAEMDARLTPGQAALIVPPGTPDPGFPALPLVEAGRFGGHAWEQAVLPRAWPGRLLNLCNTAPVMHRDQIVCIHDANVFVAPDSYGRGFRTLYRTLQPLLARRAARITTVSAHSAREIAHHLSLNPADIPVLPNGYEHALAWDPALARAAPEALRARDGGEERPFVLALGSRARHKNLRLVHDLAPRLAERGLDVVVAGGAQDIFAREALDPAPNVRLLGMVSDHDLAYLMERALCLVFPSWTEGFGIPVVEAMARGCAVVSSDRASLPEICGDAALLAAPDDPAAFLRHIEALSGSETLRRDLVGRGRERVRRFSWAETASGYADLLTSGATARAAKDPASRRDLPRIAVAVATLGRPDVAAATVRRLLAGQTLKPAALIVSCVTPEDAGEAASWPGVTLVTGRRGLAAQRNAALAALPPGIDVVAFFDDDFVADPGWLAAAAQLFRDRPEVVGMTGEVVADGIKGPGLDAAQAERLLAAAPARIRAPLAPFSPYGCNMAFRVSAIGDLRFDERLVLYGWLEDRDFGAALARRGGQLVKCFAARGVHLGVKGGRIAGDRLGYSQVVNPLYMLNKGTMTVGQVLDHLFRNISSNVVLAARPEPFVDRRGRLRGNVRGIVDVLMGRLEPERATSIGPMRR